MDNPLAHLRDIHLPEPIGFWPLAPGYYFLIALMVFLALILGWYFYRKYKNTLAKREALKLLAAYQKAYPKTLDPQAAAEAVVNLLKRVALVYYPREAVAGLHGEAWIEFLDKSAKAVDFKKIKQLVLEVPFQADSKQAIEPLFLEAKKWIQQRSKPC